MNTPSSIPSFAALEMRSRILRAVREFFHREGFIETETPVRIPTPALEAHIDAPPSGKAWLRTSPELHMKRLLATGHLRIFQMGACFREQECGPRHNPEFTLLEWYRAHADYLDILRDTERLIAFVFSELGHPAGFSFQGQFVNLTPPWMRVTVRDAFLKWAGWDPVADWDADRFDTDLMERIELALPRDRPCVLMDYPMPAAALARPKPGDGNVAERWEVYIGGYELANAYSELCDAALQRARFETAAETRRQHGRRAYALDEPFLRTLEQGLPPCGGIALGIDRLVMLAFDATDIAAVRPFCQRPGELW